MQLQHAVVRHGSNNFANESIDFSGLQLPPDFYGTLLVFWQSLLDELLVVDAGWNNTAARLH
jgi:hypothetical protein